MGERHIRSIAESLALLSERAADGCLVWTGIVSTAGYGRIKVGGRRRPAHRVSYELARGPIPEGLELDHLCRNRRCIEPTHLEPVTTRENLLRGATIPAANLQKTHCPAGHPYAGANLYVAPSRPDRQCRACIAARAAARRRAG